MIFIILLFLEAYLCEFLNKWEGFTLEIGLVKSECVRDFIQVNYTILQWFDHSNPLQKTTKL